MCPRVAWRHGSDALPTLQMVMCAGNMHRTLLLLLTPMARGSTAMDDRDFFLTCLFLSFGPEFAPSAYAQSYFQSCVISIGLNTYHDTVCSEEIWSLTTAFRR